MATKKREDGDELKVSEAFSRALQKNSEWADKDDLLDVLYWGRQILGLLVGIVWGLIPLKGLLAILIYVAISTFAGHFYVTSYQGQDEENFGGFWELAKEGFASAVATFLIAWITIYSAVNFN
ncbi:unnamed protein product [Bursaphelenchus xylophilus]|uniref:(pine wood nematode) hypothetical protein n=1 Tax=Bursaphelenchus xylophilus TaxID=6326 RepID=A0A1I7RNN8_BURXY|nr:unnamed protein product [Bursaphelenchus xylophilus]CAG9124188.1 unnamed protein product [Bursaphelenchus xylophilus]